jgi:exodeoxyribonuclease V alpha subunit
MTVHMSARLAWHMNGWNGHVCENPSLNTYCVGPSSYPGEMIAERRDLKVEMAKGVRGECCTKLKGGYIPPCVYSINAFGSEQIRAFADPPSWFNDETERKVWDMLPSTIGIWPYECMYGDEVELEGGAYDNDQRQQNVKNYFSAFDEDQSLIFYYSNYSNPLNQADERRYVIVGMSRVKKIGKLRYFDGCSPRVLERYAGGMIWQCDVTSHYPDQGLRLPYHLYLDQPKVLEKFAFFPDNPRLFKFATRQIADDDALDLVERFLEIAGTLHDLDDKSENWPERIKWLQQLVGELWRSRGLYPGMPAVLEMVGFEAAIPFWKERAKQGKEQGTRDALFAFLDGKANGIDGLKVEEKAAKGIVRQWKLQEDEQRTLMRDLLPRLDLKPDQMRRVLSPEREDYSIYSSLKAISDNPYILCEEYAGEGPDDVVGFAKIDHGVFPSPELGAEALAEKDDWRRLRGACVAELRRETKQVFLPADRLIHDVNHRLGFLPEWKRHQFTERYLGVDEEELSEALVFREAGRRKYVYWRPNYENERVIEEAMRELANRADIPLRSAVTLANWRSFLTHKKSVVAQKAPEKYQEVINQQAEACQKVFLRPLSVICGGAGTGKTKVIDAIIKAIDKGHGTGTAFKLLAPTGKAADRIREATEKPAFTIHSFLAQLGWLNQNRTFKRSGGKREQDLQTIIVDEASMLDLGLAATLFRAVKWKDVQRLIFVGDPNQLPPIGTGKVFADLIAWMREEHPESIVQLEKNVRQMENEIDDRGRGILSLASLYVRKTGDLDREAEKADAEILLQKVQEGGDVDKDLRVLYWRDADDLKAKLTAQVVADIEEDTGLRFDHDKPEAAWRKACEDKDGHLRPEYLQVISPYRGEPFGTESLNVVVQELLQPYARRGSGRPRKEIDGIMISDKVIQIKNRYGKEPGALHAFNESTWANEPVEVFNGQLGFVRLHGLDKGKLGNPWFRLERFQVVFSRKPNLWVGYGRSLGWKDQKNRKLGRIWNQSVEENLELAYAISVHKAQGSEFERVYFIVPKHKAILLSTEMFYTGLTRAQLHCTLLVEEDVAPLLSMRRPEKSHLLRINSSLFDFRPLPDELLDMGGWYEEGKIYGTLTPYMVRSKSEVIIANMLFERDITFRYETKLTAPDGTFYLPDFTLTWKGEKWYWEHWGLMEEEEYRNHRDTKKQWYERHFPGRLVETVESTNLSADADALIKKHFS